MFWNLDVREEGAPHTELGNSRQVDAGRMRTRSGERGPAGVHLSTCSVYSLTSSVQPSAFRPLHSPLPWHSSDIDTSLRSILMAAPAGLSAPPPRTSPVVPSTSLPSSRAAWLLFLRSYCSALEPSPTALFAPFTAFDSATPSSLETLPFLGFSCPSSHLPGCTISVSCAGSFFQLAHYLLISSLAYCPCLICTQNVKAGFW